MKEFLKSKYAVILYAIVFLLVVSLVSLSVSFSNTKDDLKRTISENNSKISETDKKINEYSSVIEENKKEIEKYKSENSKIQSELDKAKKENASLKNKIKKLSESDEKKSADKPAVKPKSKSANQSKAEKKLIKELTTDKKKQAGQKNNVCYLTFDDGPSKNTPGILEILKKKKVKATFFVIGSGNLDLLPRMVKEGHAIGLHSNTHDYSYIYSSSENYLKDLKAISDKVYKKTKTRPQIMRFPGGSNNTVSRRYCIGIMSKLASLVPKMGYNYIDWNVCAGDAERTYVPASEIISNTLNGANGRDSICVLLHDAPGKATTVDALPKIIDGLKKRGFKFETITPKTNGYHFKVAN